MQCVRVYNLENPDISISKIALRTVFYNANYFNQNFKAIASIIRHLDYTSARLRRLGFGVVAFFDRFTDLKAEKTAVFALIRLRNSAVYLFSATSLRIFGSSCTPKCAMYPFVLALPHSQLSLYEPTLSFNFLQFGTLSCSLLRGSF